MKNRPLRAGNLYLSDVAEALQEKEIELTVENLKAAATHVEMIAYAHARAILHDTSKDAWLEWIETFKQQ